MLSCKWCSECTCRHLNGDVITHAHNHNCTTAGSRIHFKEATTSLSPGLLPLSHAQGCIWLSLQTSVKTLMVIKCITRASKEWGFSAPDVSILRFHVWGCNIVMPHGYWMQEGRMHYSVAHNFYLLRPGGGLIYCVHTMCCCPQLHMQWMYFQS